MSSTTDIIFKMKTAIDTDRTDIVCALLSELQKNANDVDLLKKVLGETKLEGGTLLHYATKHELGKQDKVRALLSAGADPCVPSAEGKLPIDGAPANMRSVYNEELLQATAQSNLGRVCQLLAAGVEVNLLDSEETQSTPLHWAASYGNKDMVQCLCTRGAQVNRFNNAGMTPLHEAVRRGDRSVVEELLAFGADPELTVSSGEHVGQTSHDLAGNREDLTQALQAPRSYSSHPAARGDLVNGLHPIPGSKANLVRFDSYASGDGLLNGLNDVPPSPSLPSPSFKKLNKEDAEGNNVTLKGVRSEEKLNLLWPQPQSMVQGGGKPFLINDLLSVLILPSPGHICPGQVAEMWNIRRSRFEALGVKLTLDLLTSLSDRDAPHVICHVSPRLCPGYGTYKLTITPKQMKLVCGTMESLSYAISTLLQLMWLYKDDTHIHIPTLLIDDWPELPYRGVLLDFSQGRIPDMLLLEETLDTLSTLKVNQVHLYCRFRSKTPPQWQFCFTRRELLHLVDFCRQRQLTLLPVLEVGPKVQFEDLPQLYGPFTDFLACFSHAEFVSCGPRLSSFLLDTSGEEQVDVSEACKMVPLGRDQTLQLCGYPLHDLSTPLLQQLPPNIVFNEYGVKADHDFSSFCTTLAEMGIHFCVCPGTAAWNSLAGCPEAAMHNIYRAVKSGSSQGALGVVVCDWTGKGHLTHQPFAWPGFVVGAGMAWNTQCQWDDIVGPLSDLLSQHVYCDPYSVLGEVIVELGRAETFAIRRATNKTGEYVHNLPEEHGSVLFRLLTYPDGVPLEHLSTDTLQLVSRHVKTCQTALNKVAEWEGYVRTQGVIKELLLTIDFMLLACKIGKALVLAGLKPGSQSSAGFSVVNFGVNNLTATARTDLANRLLELSNTYKEVWTQRYLDSVGLTDSMATLRSLLRLLLPESHSDSLLHSPSKTP